MSNTETPYIVHPKQHIAIDCIILGYKEENLRILLSHRRFQPAEGEWSLIGGWVREDETVEKAAERVLYTVTGLKNTSDHILPRWRGSMQ